MAPVLARFDNPAWAGISCGRGWYPILLRLDAQIAQIAPDYQVLQVKEKFGALRYYWALPGFELECCAEWHQRHPRPEAGDNATATERNAWLERREGHAAGQRHGEQLRAFEAEKVRREELCRRIESLVRLAEEESARTCEECGEPGKLDDTHTWVKTLCRTCRERRALQRSEEWSC